MNIEHYETWGTRTVNNGGLKIRFMESINSAWVDVQVFLIIPSTFEIK
jgi:hypothetical protein